MLFTLCGFVLFYSSLLVVDIILMRKYIRMGPVEALYPAAPSLNPAACSGRVRKTNMSIPIDYEYLRLDLVAASSACC